jgi:hypothetical protein
MHGDNSGYCEAFRIMAALCRRCDDPARADAGTCPCATQQPFPMLSHLQREQQVKRQEQQDQRLACSKNYASAAAH